MTSCPFHARTNNMVLEENRLNVGGHDKDEKKMGAHGKSDDTLVIIEPGAPTTPLYLVESSVPNLVPLVTESFSVVDKGVLIGLHSCMLTLFRMSVAYRS